MKVNFISFCFFYDSLSINGDDIIDMVSNNAWSQKHKLFRYPNSFLLGTSSLAELIIATDCVIRETNEE